MTIWQGKLVGLEISKTVQQPYRLEQQGQFKKTAVRIKKVQDKTDITINARNNQYEKTEGKNC